MTELAASSAPRPAFERAVVLLAALSWTAALIHAVVVPEHWEEYVPYALAFALLAAAQVAWSVALFRDPSARVLRAGAVLSAGVVAVWTLSRTTGVPIGPDRWEPEAVGPLDAAASAAELAIAATGLAYWRSWPADPPRWTLWLGSTLLLGAGVALTLGGGHSR